MRATLLALLFALPTFGNEPESYRRELFAQYQQRLQTRKTEAYRRRRLRTMAKRYPHFYRPLSLCSGSRNSAPLDFKKTYYVGERQ